MMGNVSAYAWAGVAILLVVVLLDAAPRWGGGLLLALVLGMVWTAHTRNYI